MVIDKAQGLSLISQSQKNDKSLKSIFEKLSTGKKINRASDNAALLSIAKELEKQVRGFQAAENNIGDALSAIRVSDGATDSISNMLQRQRELAIQANNGTLNQSQRNALNDEFQALTSEIDRQSRAAQFNKQSLLDGQSALSNGTGVVQAGANNTSNDQVTLPGADVRASTLGIDNLDISNPANISSAISAIDSARAQVSSVRTNLGSSYNRLESAGENAANTRINTANALSLAEDLDYAEGVADQARASLLQQSNIEATRNFNNIARNNLSALLSGQF